MNSLFNDIFLGIKKGYFWITYSLNDIKKKYRRKFLGQSWIIINTLLFILVIYFVFRQFLADKYDNYLIYFSIGYIVWSFMSGCINSSATLFFQSKSFLLNKYWPLSTFVFRLLLREIIIFFHNIIIIPFYFFIFRNMAWF